jgi:hypothetical protein
MGRPAQVIALEIIRAAHDVAVSRQAYDQASAEQRRAYGAWEMAQRRMMELIDEASESEEVLELARPGKP